MSSYSLMYPNRYGDPIRAALLALPFISDERCVEFAQSWDSAKPTVKIHSALWWYTLHDRTLIFSLRGFVAVLPLILTLYDVGVEWIAFAVIVGLYVTETLARKRESLKKAQWMEDAYDMHTQMRRERAKTDPTIL